MASVLPARPTVSFELMPPRHPDAAPRFWTTVRHLVAARPDFVSVTYGAAGTDRATTRAVVTTLAARTPVLPIAHLTCVGATRAEITEVITEMLDAGVRSFLALRGDPPQDQPDWAPAPDGLQSSNQLVGLLRLVEAQRCSQSQATALRGAAHPLTIAVATFPAGNPAAGTSVQQEVERLLGKQLAGADFAITQLFYDARTYLDFVARARAEGVTIPILAGILPMTDPARLRRVEALAGVQPPAALLRDLERLDDEGERYRLGMAATVELAQAVLGSGAPGLHIYTFNTHQAALDLLEGVHLGGDGSASALAAPDPSDLASGPWVVGATETDNLRTP